MHYITHVTSDTKPSHFSACNIEKLERAWGQGYTLTTLVFNIILYEHPCHFIGLIRMVVLIQCNIVISLLFQVEEYRNQSSHGHNYVCVIVDPPISDCIMMVHVEVVLICFMFSLNRG